MAGIRKRTWTNKSGKHTCYEINCLINGQQIRKSGYATKQAAQDDLTKVTQEINTNIKLGELCRVYIDEHSLLHCKESTKKLYEGYINNNLTDLTGKRAKDISKRDLDLLVLRFKAQGLSNKSINNVISFLRSVYKNGITDKLVSQNPANDIKKLPKNVQPAKFFNIEQMQEFERIIETFPLERYVPLLVDLYSGMRISELIAVERCDLEVAECCINVNKQYYKGRLTSTKTGKSRKIFIPRFVMDKILELIQQQKVSSKIVFCGSTGGYLNQGKFVMNWFKKAVKLMGLEDYNFHCLRHTYAAYLLSKGVSIKFVQEQLGHSTPQTTLNIYNHVMPSVSLEAMNILKNLHFEHDLNMVENKIAETQ